MPVPIQSGEAQARLRRFLNLDAGLAVNCDEIAVPVVVLGSADQAPYRTDGRKWVSDGDNTQPAVAAQLASVGIRTAPAAWTLIEGFRLRTTVAPCLVYGRLDVGYLPASGIVCVDVESPRSTFEDAFRPAGPLIQIASAVGAPTGSLVWWGHALVTPDPSQAEVHLAHPILLPPDDSQDIEFILTNTVVLQALSVQFWGRVFDAPVFLGR